MIHKKPGVVAIGLTGAIGAGKSTALAYFAELGALTLSADGVVRKLYEQPQVCSVIADRFGAHVLDETGAVNRRVLAERVCSNLEDLRWLEQLTHPHVAATIEQFIQQAPAGSVVVCEVPLLVETGMQSLFDLVVTIEAAPEVRRARSPHAFGPDVFARFESLQASPEERIKQSHFVYFNDGSLVGLKDFVARVYDHALSLIREQGGDDQDD